MKSAPIEKASLFLCIVFALIYSLACMVIGEIVFDFDPKRPTMPLYSWETKPAPNAVVYVRYRWGGTMARYLDGKEPMLLEYYSLHDGESSEMPARYDLLEVFGPPIYWAYDVPIPRYLEESTLKP